MTDNKHGGARPGSGRKPKAPTTTINFRVPVEKVSYLKPLVSTYIKGLLNQPPVTEAQVPTIQEKPAKPVKKDIVSKKPVEKEVKEPVPKFNLKYELDKLREQDKK